MDGRNICSSHYAGHILDEYVIKENGDLLNLKRSSNSSLKCNILKNNIVVRSHQIIFKNVYWKVGHLSRFKNNL